MKTMTTEQQRELLELAAKAVDVRLYWRELLTNKGSVYEPRLYSDGVWGEAWNPLKDDGDALRLAVRLNLDIRYESYDAGVAVIVGGSWDDAPEAVHEIFERDGPSATRLAITRAAAEIGRNML